MQWNFPKNICIIRYVMIAVTWLVSDGDLQFYLFLIKLKLFLSRFDSVQPMKNFYRFRIGSVSKVLVSIRLNFWKTQTDPITGIDLAVQLQPYRLRNIYSEAQILTQKKIDRNWRIISFEI